MVRVQVYLTKKKKTKKKQRNKNQNKQMKCICCHCHCHPPLNLSRKKFIKGLVALAIFSFIFNSLHCYLFYDDMMEYMEDNDIFRRMNWKKSTDSIVVNYDILLEPHDLDVDTDETHQGNRGTDETAHTRSFDFGASTKHTNITSVDNRQEKYITTTDTAPLNVQILIQDIHTTTTTDTTATTTTTTAKDETTQTSAPNIQPFPEDTEPT